MTRFCGVGWGGVRWDGGSAFHLLASCTGRSATLLPDPVSIHLTITPNYNGFAYSTLRKFPKHDFSLIKLKGNCTSNQNWACFAKLSTLFWKKKMSILKQIVWETKKGQAALQLSIKIVFWTSWSIIQDSRSAWPFNVIFWVNQTICIRIGLLTIFSKQVLINFKTAHKTCSILVSGVVPP